MIVNWDGINTDIFRCLYSKKKYKYLVNDFYRIKIKSHLFVIFTILLVSINSIAQTTINYSYDSSNFCNPERGFYKYSDGASIISPSTIASYRNSGYTLLYRIYYISNSASLSSAFLTKFDTDMQALRTGGMKCILRFAYTSTNSNDAPISTVLSHLTQLEPHFENNYDVIAILQAGFIGRWGEWYYTNNFGDQGNITSTNWADRTTLLKKELSVLPEERMVAIRNPVQKKIMLNRTTAITSAEAYDESDWSRVGFHDDAFVASSDDWGTFPNGQVDRNFLAGESKYLVTGGEAETHDLYLNECSNSEIQMANFHFSYINRDYNLATINKWIIQGCFYEFEKKMGYRFYLKQGTYTSHVKPGNTFNLNITLINEGYAAPFNPRDIEIVLKNLEDGTECRAKLNLDPRKWLPGTITINQSIGIPFTYPPGVYKVYLNLPDPVSSLKGNPNYSIRLAKTNIWEESTGYNDLGLNLVISHTATGVTYTGNQWFDACYGSNIPPIVTIIDPLDGTALMTGSDITINANANDMDGTLVKVEFYSSSTKIGEDISSPYNYTWENVSKGIYTITVKAVDDLGTVGKSIPVVIAVNDFADIPPVVSITQPVNNKNFTTNSNITISATASDSDGSVSKVEFYADSIKLGVSNTSPYSLEWNSVPHGNYSITGVVIDDLGEITRSEPIYISVNSSPSITLTEPLNKVYPAPGTITISADAIDQDGTIVKVEFYNGPTLIATDNSAPYTYVWNNVTKGIYTITAKTIDNNGAVARTTIPIIVTVGYPPQTPKGGSAWSIPGKIEAENYDEGGQDIAYQDFSSGNYFEIYRTDGVDIENCFDTGGGYNVSATQKGEWMEYTVDVINSQNYDILVRVATFSPGKYFHIELDGVNVSGKINIPNTGGWQKWTTIIVPNIYLTAGQKNMRIVMDTDLININYVSYKFSTVNAIEDMVDINNHINIFPNPNEGVFDIEFFISANYQYDLVIYNSVGEIVYSENDKLSNGLNINRIQLAQLSSGLYLIQINAGDFSYTQKIEKK